MIYNRGGVFPFCSEVKRGKLFFSLSYLTYPDTKIAMQC